jgi:hypothetical protein
MGIRDWLKRKDASPIPASNDDPADEPDEGIAFAELQERRRLEARSLFDEDEVVVEAEELQSAPYDASEGSVEDLHDSSEESFTHADEIEIEDVSLLDDPYAHAKIEGDVPEPVEFDE